ncbi:MAG: prepilin-type N-terminal cleavage/methylation domain-containing protein [Cellvibrionaceae bacterium]|nr:prepilin-type N-terminal cleavage/methylation domain-containing protein [Cellvibrionaceae bacterium]MCV6626954.1 prepilin-type N-terminal cleavage/methylation domain-containing protein [Cellvibrionaceae bacterium]
MNSRLIQSAANRRGFTLLEMLVTVAILGLSLGALYQAISGASRNVRVDEKYTYAIILAQSLMQQHSIVPVSGLDQEGETDGGFQWRVEARPRTDERPQGLAEGALQDIVVEVKWQDGPRQRAFELNSVVVGVQGDE